MKIENICILKINFFESESEFWKSHFDIGGKEDILLGVTNESI